ncbi:MAG: dihydroorotate dehydrogenase [Erysipelotrichaceae bacterium]|nr:dihydroorotate dehydrogenase [Erysipelotrichaceae bacterium]
MERLKVKLNNLELDNPVIPASGTYGFGYDYLDFYDPNILGSISLKGTTLHPRFGNVTPRIAECHMGMLNSVGLQNPGIHKVIEEELVKLDKIYHKKIIFNVSGFNIDEYVECVRLLDNIDKVGIIEVNISCPNVKDGGLSFGSDCSSAASVTKEVRKVTTKPLFIKLSPNVSNIADIAKSCEDEGADGISMINTLIGARFNLKTGKPILHNVTGGFSGPAILPVALRMVYEVYERVNIPIIGIGGISSAYDVIEMMYAGASAIQIGSSNLVDPYTCKKVIDDLPLVMDELNIKKITDIIGRAHK